MFSFKKKNHGEQLTSLIVRTEGTTTATIHQNKSGKPLLEHCGFYPLSPGQDIQENLKLVVRDQGLDNRACATVLDISDYHLLMVEAPEVPQTELANPRFNRFSY